MSSNLVVSLYWYEALFFILSVISHGDGFRERRALEWLIPIGIIIFYFILSLSDTRILKSWVPRAFSFVGSSQLSRVEFQRYFFWILSAGTWLSIGRGFECCLHLLKADRWPQLSSTTAGSRCLLVLRVISDWLSPQFLTHSVPVPSFRTLVPQHPVPSSHRVPRNWVPSLRTLVPQHPVPSSTSSSTELSSTIWTLFYHSRIRVPPNWVPLLGTVVPS